MKASSISKQIHHSKMSANPDPKPLSSTLSKPLAKPGFRNHSQTRYLLHIQEEITLLLQESTY
jgi:hypothetical protein